MPRIEIIPIFQIIIPQWRRMQEKIVLQLMESIPRVGQLSPVMVEQVAPNQYRLRYGGHRLEALIRLGIKDVLATVMEGLDADQAELISLDENLARGAYSCVLEESISLSRQKVLYERVHPQTRHGGKRTRASPTKSDLTPSFVQKTATELGKDSSTVENRVKIGRVLQPFADIIYGTPLEDQNGSF
jgi:ParB family chromosome partitioning protein